MNDFKKSITKLQELVRLEDQKVKTPKLYVLRLQGGKFYIGKTDRQNMQQRLEEHVSGQGAEWTRTYEPLEMVETKPAESLLAEDELVYQYMSYYGLENVRGGTYSKVDLTPSDKEHIQKQLAHAKGNCLSCYKPGHFAKDCSIQPKKSFHVPILFQQPTKQLSCFGCGQTGHLVKACPMKINQKAEKKGECFRCGRAGHWIKDCYATTHVKGYLL